MTMVGMPWIAMASLQPYRSHQLAWFVYGAIEREQLLHLTACVGWGRRSSGISTGLFETPGHCLEIAVPPTGPRMLNDKGEQGSRPWNPRPNRIGSLT
jgi:hypothetical protein